MEPFLALICIFGSNFAPRGWALCNGQILSIAQNTALFSLLGTTYGGNGQTTFALPDLRGRAPIGWGQGPGLPNVSLGEVGGTPNTTLTSAQMPMHTHAVSLTFQVSASNAGGTTGTPSASANTLAGLADSSGNEVFGYNSQAPNTVLNTGGAATGNTTIAGGSQPLSIMQPYLGVTFIIALEGIFPSRD
ncbi:tail fiber protein [Chitinophaga horti]|uniref:Tail fiber protein n=1 Tax=Chitinophaga horti TaxID=2920382 RepID=A0ABY6J7F5_9BACT|nr:tail fiber protein [Chitinophaga horti]UYQ95578.1 tail fiber protein [Chitinophaga horti]